ncbi:hypothetical protein [Bradyrhizobium icense]|uniref:Uncharacterized protein n=1 Tax=Bradyrhizobium icense TaxID=1274631 RepID=A0A1B1UC07_9BRAD|nr:hypothetical protein LMTR13_09090 [Bradyrhizobium icense]
MISYNSQRVDAGAAAIGTAAPWQVRGHPPAGQGTRYGGSLDGHDDPLVELDRLKARQTLHRYRDILFGRGGSWKRARAAPLPVAATEIPRSGRFLFGNGC